MVAPEGYPEFLARLKDQVATARQHATRVVNTGLITLYWDLGAAILDRQDTQGWGATVVDRIATDLQAAFPDMRGFSRSNLYAMRKLARTWPRDAVVQQAVGQLPWGHVTVLLDKLTTSEDREFYAAAAVEHGWSRNVLTHHITTSLRTRIGAAPSNFADQLPAPDSDLAQQLVRDPYVFDFLTLTTRVAERDLEDALMGRLQRFLLELGHGFAFVGRQHRFTVDGQDFAIDLLFFNYLQSRFVVVELKGRRIPTRLPRPARLLRRLGRRQPPRPAPPRSHHRHPDLRWRPRQRRPLLPRRRQHPPRRGHLHLRRVAPDPARAAPHRHRARHRPRRHRPATPAGPRRLNRPTGPAPAHTRLCHHPRGPLP